MPGIATANTRRRIAPPRRSRRRCWSSPGKRRATSLPCCTTAWSSARRCSPRTNRGPPRSTLSAPSKPRGGPTDRRGRSGWAAWGPTASKAAPTDPTCWSSGCRSTLPRASSPANRSRPPCSSRPRLTITAGLTGWVVGYTLRPLRRLAATAAEVAAMPLTDDDGRIGARVQPRDTDPDNEVGIVGHTLNRLLDNVDSALAHRANPTCACASSSRTPAMSCEHR